MYDFTIIGAGITGSLIARELSKYNVKTLVLEKENDVGNHATLANSAIIHSGHDPEHGTLKAQLCVLGNRLYDDLEKELKIPLLRTGGMVIARDKDELKTLKSLQKNAQKNHVEKIQLLNKETLLKREPNLSEAVMMGLDLPTTKVTYPWEVAIRGLENAISNGVSFKKNTEVTAIEKKPQHFIIRAAQTTFKSRYIINAAGTFAAKIAAMIEKDVPYKMHPRIGEYLVLDRRVKGYINHTIYPVPSDKGKGTLIVPQVHGNILLGPTSYHQTDLEATPNTQAGLKEIKTEASKLAKDIPFDQVIRTFAGLRATIDYDDFYIKYSKESENFIHVAGIDSPGLTAAPAIAQYVVDHLIKPKETLKKKSNFSPDYEAIKMYHDMDTKERQAAYQKDARHGNLVCKCEKITEADVINHIERPLGASSMKGLKKRARIGSGLCQGGYCEHQAIRLLAKTLNEDPTAIDYYQKNTPILIKETKVKR